jgi:hypothetical protein
MHKQFLALFFGALLIGCNDAPPPKPVLPPPIQSPPKIEFDVQQLLETAEKELAPVDPPSFAPDPAVRSEE